MIFNLSTRERTALLHAYQSNLQTAIHILESNPILAAEARKVFGLSGENTDIAKAIFLKAIKQDALHEIAAHNNARRRAAAVSPKPKPAPAAPTPRPVAIAPKPTVPPVNPLADATDRYIIQAAIHRSSPEPDRIAARAELERRGINITPEGIRTESMRGGRAARIAAQLSKS